MSISPTSHPNSKALMRPEAVPDHARQARSDRADFAIEFARETGADMSAKRASRPEVMHPSATGPRDMGAHLSEVRSGLDNPRAEGRERADTWPDLQAKFEMQTQELVLRLENRGPVRD